MKGLIKSGFLVLLLVLAGCSKREKNIIIPKGIVAKDTMERILFDVHLIEGAKVGSTIVGNDSLNPKDYYYWAYDKYGIDQDHFEKSFIFYTSNPSLASDIYENIIDSLNTLEAYYTKLGGADTTNF